MPKHFFLTKKKILTQTMTSHGPPKIVQIHMRHPVYELEFSVFNIQITVKHQLKMRQQFSM